MAGEDDPNGAATARGGTPAAFGFVLALVALAGLWLDRAVVHSGAEAAAVAAAVAGMGVVLSVAGWRAARASGASGRGALVCAFLGALVLAGAVAVLVVA